MTCRCGVYIVNFEHISQMKLVLNLQKHIRDVVKKWLIFGLQPFLFTMICGFSSSFPVLSGTIINTTTGFLNLLPISPTNLNAIRLLRVNWGLVSSAETLTSEYYE